MNVMKQSIVFLLVTLLCTAQIISAMPGTSNGGRDVKQENDGTKSLPKSAAPQNLSVNSGDGKKAATVRSAATVSNPVHTSNFPSPSSAPPVPQVPAAVAQLSSPSPAPLAPQKPAAAAQLSSPAPSPAAAAQLSPAAAPISSQKVTTVAENAPTSVAAVPVLNSSGSDAPKAPVGVQSPSSSSTNGSPIADEGNKNSMSISIAAAASAGIALVGVIVVVQRVKSSRASEARNSMSTSAPSPSDSRSSFMSVRALTPLRPMSSSRVFLRNDELLKSTIFSANMDSKIFELPPTV